MAKIGCGVRKPGKRGKTRSKLKKRGSKVTVNQIVKNFDVGDKVQVVIDPSFHGGFPDKSFHGQTGYITGKRGLSYEIDLKRGKKDFMVVTTPVHIKKLQ